jgi:hypothetical protein
MVSHYHDQVGRIADAGYELSDKQLTPIDALPPQGGSSALRKEGAGGVS